MRKLLVLAFAALLGPASAGAAPLNWEGTMEVLLGEFPKAQFLGGGVATVNGSAGSLPAHLDTARVALSRGAIATPQFTLFVTDPETAGNSIAAIKFTNLAMGTGTWGAISGGATSANPLSPNILPVRGLVKICLLDVSCTQFLPLLLTQATNTTTASPAIQGVGIGGMVLINAGIMISIEAAPWTIKTATVTDEIETASGADFTQVTLMGFAHGPSSLASSTAAVSGVLQVVTPAQVTTNLPNGSNAKISAGITTTLHFIPEPGLLLLIGSGIAGLAVLGHQRLRRR